MTARRRFEAMQRRKDEERQPLEYERGVCPWMAIVRDFCFRSHVIIGRCEGWSSDPYPQLYAAESDTLGSAGCDALPSDRLLAESPGRGA